VIESMGEQTHEKPATPPDGGIEKLENWLVQNLIIPGSSLSHYEISPFSSLFQKNSALIFPLFFERRRAVTGYDKKIGQSQRVDVQKTAGKSAPSFSQIGPRRH
jgi:hypothetical protein